jgi:hypothetical protein
MLHKVLDQYFRRLFLFEQEKTEGEEKDVAGCLLGSTRSRYG